MVANYCHCHPQKQEQVYIIKVDFNYWVCLQHPLYVLLAWRVAVPCIASNFYCRYNITPPCHLFSGKWVTKIQVLVVTHNHSFVSREWAQRGQWSYYLCQARLLSNLMIAGGERCLPRHVNQYVFLPHCWNITSVEEWPVGCTDHRYPCLKKCLDRESRGGHRRAARLRLWFSLLKHQALGSEKNPCLYPATAPAAGRRDQWEITS